MGDYTDDECDTLLDIARISVTHGVENGHVPRLDASAYPPALREHRATFVTLHTRGALRGCIGVLDAVRPLIKDVAHNAHAAAFSDPRFPSIAAAELSVLHVHISILSPPQDFPVTSQSDLLNQLRPGVDGLILEEGWHRATFLPSVWETLTDARTFVAQLKLKAGLSADYWSDQLRFKRYSTISIKT